MRYSIEEFINDVLTELSFRNDTGIPDLTQKSDLNELYSILEEYEIPYSVIDEFIQKLTETVDLTDTARNTIASKGLEHMGYGYYGKNDEVMYKKNEKGDLVPSTDDSYKKDVEDQQKKAGNVDKKKDGKRVKPTPSTSGEEPQAEPKSVFNTVSGQSYIEDLPDGDPAKSKVESINIDDIVSNIIESFLIETDYDLIKHNKNIYDSSDREYRLDKLNTNIKETISKLGEILSEASIYDSKYTTGDKFLPLKQTSELFSKSLPKGEKVPKGPFTKEDKTDKFVEVNIGSGPTVFVSADDTKKTYKITASQNQFKSLFGKMRKGASVQSINWNTQTLETAACFGLYINGVSILNQLNSAKNQDDIPIIISKIKDKINSAISSSGDYAASNEIQSKLDTMPLTDWYVIAQLMAGMTQFTNNILKFKPYLIHKSIGKYYKSTERSDLVDGVKENTADAVVSNVPAEELISKLKDNNPVEYDNNGVCSIKGTNIKFIQISLKKGKDAAQLGKIYSFLKDKYGILSNEDVINLAINEGFSDFFKRGVDFIKKTGSKFLEKISNIGKLLSGFGKKINKALTIEPKRNVDKLELELQRAGMVSSLKESLQKLNESKVSIWDSFEEISKNQRLLDIVSKNTNLEFTKLKNASDMNPAFYYKGYKELKPKAPIPKDDVAKLITNFQSAIVLQNMLGDLESDSKQLYSQMIELEKEMIYGRTTLPLYKVYGLNRDGSGTPYEQYPGSEKFVEEKLNKDLSDIVVFYLYSSDNKNYFTLRGYGLSGISETTGDLKYSQFRMGTNDSGRYSYNFEGTQELPIGKVKKSLGI